MAAHDRCSGIVTAAFDAKDSQRARHALILLRVR